MATVSHAHFEFFDATGFQPGDTRVKKLAFPNHGSMTETAIAATATPFTATNENRELKVTSLSVRARDPHPATNDLPTVHVEVESLGPDAPLIWYLNVSLTES